MVEKNNYIKQSSYILYIFFGCFSVITMILVIVSMCLWDKRNATIDLLIPVLHSISQIFVVVGVLYNAIKLTRKFWILKIHNLSFYTFIAGIVIVLLSIAIGISSVFIIGSNSMLLNGINLIWIIPLLINLVMVFICYKRDKKNNIIQDLDCEKDDNNKTYYNNQGYGSEQEYYSNQYKTSQVIRHKELLTKKDYNLLIFFSSLVFILIIGYIALIILFNYISPNKFFETVITSDGSTLTEITSDGYKVIAVSVITALSLFLSIIGVPVMNFKISRKIALINNNTKDWYIYSIKICNWVCLSLISILISIVTVFNFKLNSSNNSNKDELNTLFIVGIFMAALIIIDMIGVFVLSILAKRNANKQNYFEKSRSLNEYRSY